MRTERWKKIKEILEEALQLEDSARGKYLSQLVVDEEILLEVRSLLEDAEATEHFLSEPASSFAKDFYSDTGAQPDPIVGQQIGIYKIVRELGHGGMGVVYLASRTDGKFEQNVAVKMLKREYNTKSIRRSFERERQIQAALIHPNIATLLDAGTTPEGIPYLVMEYVVGEPVDTYCQNRNLGLNDRLKLFNRACEAVSFAHRNLIVHRDIKPSNIIVAENGEPKLLDFGISKLIDEREDPSSTLTNQGAMTPNYASPEQINADPITTATDIYSLGVILFRILTNSHPFANVEGNGGLLEAVVNKEPMTPSEARKSEDALGDSETDHLIESSQLKGDLDNIVLKALRKEPDRRYTTVEQLSDDIWRYIDRLPVNARRSTLLYRASKFYSRNKIPVLAGTLAVLGLILGLTIALWQSTIAQEQAAVAETAQRLAETEARKARVDKENAEMITSFMDKLISYANPGQYAAGAKDQGNAKVIDAIDAMGGDIESTIPDRVDIQAELHHKFAEVYLMRADFARNSNRHNDKKKLEKKAAFHARRALALRRQHFGEKHELIAKDLFYIWATSVPTEKSEAGLLADAIRMMRETDPNDLNLPNMLYGYANRLHTIGSEKEKEEYFRDAKATGGMDRLSVAESYFQEALALFRKQDDVDDYTITILNCRVAMVMADQGRVSALKSYYDACVKPNENLNDAQIINIRDMIQYIGKAVDEEK